MNPCFSDHAATPNEPGYRVWRKKYSMRCAAIIEAFSIPSWHTMDPTYTATGYADSDQPLASYRALLLGTKDKAERSKGYWVRARQGAGSAQLLDLYGAVLLGTAFLGRVCILHGLCVYQRQEKQAKEMGSPGTSTRATPRRAPSPAPHTQSDQALASYGASYGHLKQRRKVIGQRDTGFAPTQVQGQLNCYDRMGPRYCTTHYTKDRDHLLFEFPRRVARVVVVVSEGHGQRQDVEQRHHRQQDLRRFRSAIRTI